MLKRLLEWLSVSSDQMLQGVKWISFIATLLGAYYFIAYLHFFGIPFPAEFSVMPTILLTVGVVTIIITLVVFIYILMAGWIQMDPMNMGYAELIHVRPTGVIGHGGRAAIVTIMAIYIVPFLAWMAAIFYAQEESVFHFSVLLFVFFIWASIFAFFKVRMIRVESFRDRLVLFSKILASVFLLSFFTIYSSLLYVMLLKSRGLMNNWEHVFIALLVFVAINMGVLYPIINVKEFAKANEEVLRDCYFLNRSALSKRIYKPPVYLAVGFLFVMTLIPPFSAYVGELPLKLLGLSSNASHVIYAGKKSAKSWPAGLKEQCDDDKCRSVPVIVVLDLGKSLYVRPVSGGNIYRLDHESTIESFPSVDKSG